MDDLINLRVANPNVGAGMVQFQQNGARVVQFYNKSVHNPAKSQEAGRHVYDDVIFFKSFMPGEQRFEIVDRPATRQDKQNYALQWAAFSQNQSQTPEGTPISMLYPEKPAVASTLQAYGVHTIEQCAALNANSIDSIGMGCQTWVNDAAKYLAMANQGVTATKFRKELEERDGQIRVLQQQIEQLKVQVAAAQSTPQANGVDPALVQAVIAQMSGQMRPRMPLNPLGEVFDAQTAQINATSTTAEVTRQRRGRPRKNAA